MTTGNIFTGDLVWDGEAAFSWCFRCGWVHDDRDVVYAHERRCTARRPIDADEAFAAHFGVEHCESPMEARLFWALLRNGFHVGPGEDLYCPGAGNLFPQFVAPTDAGNVRIDFAVMNRYDHVALAVEVDGHEWHERTKEQAIRDRARARALTSRGWRVISFTGSEVYRDPDAAANEVIRVAKDLSGWKSLLQRLPWPELA